MRRKQKRYKIAPLLIIGLILIAASVFVLQISRLGGFKRPVEMGMVIVMLLSWLMILFGSYSMGKTSHHYRKVGLISILAVIALIVQGVLLYRNLKNALGEDAYMDITVMFLGFVTYIFLFYA